MSARRMSPPSDGSPHDGKEIGKDVVEYVYKQVSARFTSPMLVNMHSYLAAGTYTLIPHCYRVW
jgi:hypothetical protein